MIKMVRQPSDTPNISNIDDIIPYRYAYGNQNGYVINRGSEISYTINGTQFTINSGRLVLQGVESDIDANGETVTIDSSSETRYYSIYYKVNLATNTSTIEKTYSTGSYPTINTGDDLNAITSGTANLELFRFIATNGVISNVEKIVKAIEYAGTALNGYDIAQGTIEERLTRLGFREGELVIDTTLFNTDTSITANSLSRQGNYVIGDLVINADERIFNIISSEDQPKFINIPSEFRPPENTMIDAFIEYACVNTSTFSNYTSYLISKIAVTSDGYIPITDQNVSNVLMYVKNITIHFGYEARPIE